MTARQRLRRVLAPVPGALSGVRLAVETVGIALRYRVTGLSAEGGFFMLLSLPPLLLGLVAGVGFVGQALGTDVIADVTGAIDEWSRLFFTAQVVDELIMPTVADTLRGGRADLISLGFLLSLWAGSRALHVFLDTITIMYGQIGVRGMLRSRVLSLSLYVVSILVGALIFPLVLIGPTLLAQWLPEQVQFLIGFYWPTVAVLGLASLTGLYHLATPKRSPFFRDVPGAVLAVVIWVLSSVALRSWASVAVGGSTVYGPLAAPIIVLIWFYLIALAVLVGAALNAAIRRLWPPPEYRGPVVRANQWWEQRRGGEDDGEPQPPTPVDQPPPR